MLCKNKITLTIVSLCFLNSCQNKLDPMIIITTPLGEIKAKLYSKNAPVTVNNFLSYLNQDRYDEAHFYRVVHLKNQPENEIKIEVIQGGLGLENHPKRLKSIKHETTNNTGIKIFTIVMKRKSLSNQWFTRFRILRRSGGAQKDWHSFSMVIVAKTLVRPGI